jgi:hypothetical protein
MPKNCPLCGVAVVKPEGEAMHRCPNRACPSRGLETLNNWVMAAADIEGVGEKLVWRLWELGLLRSLPDLYRLTKEQLLELDGFQETSATNVVDQQHCVTATVKDEFGNVTPGITVDFSVAPTTFRTPSSGSDVTDASGEAQFCYTSALPGGDVISAFADTDSSGTQNGTEPSDTATKTWVVPGSTAGCKVTYGGRITAANGDKATFGGNAQAKKPRGQEQYQDHGPAVALNVHSLNVLAVTCSRDKTTASIFGTARVRGNGTVDYRIDLKDLGQPGRSDTYRIRLSTGYDSGAQALTGGNVKIHK